MEFIFRPIREEDANYIISYKHGNDYRCFDSEKHASDIDTLMNSKEVDFLVAVNEDEDLIGFVEVAFDADGIMEMSGALLQEFTGEGLGFDFITQCIEYVVDFYNYEQSTLSSLVRPGDKRTIRVLERVGFQIIDESDEWIELSIDL